MPKPRSDSDILRRCAGRALAIRHGATINRFLALVKDQQKDRAVDEVRRKATQRQVTVRSDVRLNARPSCPAIAVKDALPPSKRGHCIQGGIHRGRED
jgi:hypothetical protein